MRLKPLYLLLLLCLAVHAGAQPANDALKEDMAKVQLAYDNNADSLDRMVERYVPLAIKAGDINVEMRMQRLRCDKLFVNGQYDKALKILMETVHHAAQHPATIETALLYYGAAQVNGYYKYTAFAKEYLEKGLAISIALKDDSVQGNGYDRMGIFYEKYYKNLDSALYFYQQALYHNDKGNCMVGKAYSLENIAGVYGERNDLKTALDYQLRSRAIKAVQGRKIDMAMADINIAETYDRMSVADSAIHYAASALQYSKAIDYKELAAYACQMLAQRYEKAHDYNKALDYYKQYAGIRDSIYTDAKNKELAVLNTRYETEKREQKIYELNQRATIQNLQLRQRSILLGISIIAIIAGSVIFYLVYNRRKLKERARLQEEVNKQQTITTREVLYAEERERKRIAADLHDGVGQLLSATLLNLNSYFARMGPQQSDQADRILGLVTESYDELRAISHQMMPNALLKAGLASAVKELVANIDSNKLAISLEMVGLNERLKEEVETVLYRVIQESINNVIKHAGASKLNIQVVKDEDGVSVSVEDNGKGFDPKKVKQDGIGMKNMHTRVQLQNGTVDVDSQPGKGTLVVIFIPLQEAKA